MGCNNWRVAVVWLDEVQELYNGWDCAEEVHDCIAREVKACRTDAAVFDQSSFGKGSSI